MLMFGRNQHNSVKQLSFNEKIKNKVKKRTPPQKNKQKKKISIII